MSKPTAKSNNKKRLKRKNKKKNRPEKKQSYFEMNMSTMDMIRTAEDLDKKRKEQRNKS